MDLKYVLTLYLDPSHRGYLLPGHVVWQAGVVSVAHSPEEVCCVEVVADVAGVVDQPAVWAAKGRRLVADLGVLHHLVLAVQATHDSNRLCGERLLANLLYKFVIEKW